MVYLLFRLTDWDVKMPHTPIPLTGTLGSPHGIILPSDVLQGLGAFVFVTEQEKQCQKNQHSTATSTC